jgi:hypothetical protein
MDAIRMPARRLERTRVGRIFSGNWAEISARRVSTPVLSRRKAEVAADR